MANPIPNLLNSIHNTFPSLELSHSAARDRAQLIRLQRIPDNAEDCFTSFLIARAHQLDASSNDLDAVLQLVEPFTDTGTSLRDWLVSTLLPLLRLQYEYYPETQQRLALRDVEGFEGATGVNALLQNAIGLHSKAEIGRDLRSVVAPWIYGGSRVKRRRLHAEIPGTDYGRGSADWQDVNEWLLSTSTSDFSLATRAITEWDGPTDVDLGGYQGFQNDGQMEGMQLRYSQAALAVIYASQPSSRSLLSDAWRILELAALRAKLKPPNKNNPLPEIHSFPVTFTPASKAALLHNALLRSDNELTTSSEYTIAFLEGILASLGILRSFKSDLQVKQAAELCLFTTEEQQERELNRILQQILHMTTGETDWRSVRDQLLWLHRWTCDIDPFQSTEYGATRHALLGRVRTAKLETQILNAVLTANAYQVAVELYLQTDRSPLSNNEVERCVSAAIYASYDNASNGNRFRGGMKRAFEMLKVFQPHFQTSPCFQHIDHLIAATHSLSFYQLTLQHGVPFQPVSIRVHKEPLSLIDSVLEQNPKAYTKLDDLLGIGRNLALADLPTSHHALSQVETLESRVFDAEHRITYHAIISALSSQDFDTAYSYITTRLSSASGSSPLHGRHVLACRLCRWSVSPCINATIYHFPYRQSYPSAWTSSHSHSLSHRHLTPLPISSAHGATTKRRWILCDRKKRRQSAAGARKGAVICLVISGSTATWTWRIRNEPWTGGCRCEGLWHMRTRLQWACSMWREGLQMRLEKVRFP